jgi:hypothetical protein
MRVTEDQYAEILKRTGVRGEASPADTAAPPFKLPPNEPGAFALGRLPAGTMNKTEAAYDEHLSLRHTGDIIWHKFEAVKLRLADNTFYTCDFRRAARVGVLEMHEVKGFMQDDANVKIKVAASIYPFRFKVVRKGKAACGTSRRCPDEPLVARPRRGDR